ncbi:MAG: hypothetical protein E7372_02575 [Clostridiales bacterium]|nr:hypothetical protein [Clostridiales bacterium]
MTKRISLSKMLLIIVLSLVVLSSAFVLPNNAFANSVIFLDVINSSFENTNLEQYDKPFATDWIINNGSFDADNVNIISTNAYDKINYWQFEKGTYFVESQNFIDIQSAEYIFGVKFIFSNINDSCALVVKGYNANGELISTNKGETIESKQEFIGMWQETFVTAEISDNVKKIKISIEINANNGTVGIDNVYAHKNFISVYDGASISLERNVLLLRFTAKIDADIYKTFVDNYENVSVGMVFAPRKQVVAVGEFTIKGIPEDGNVKVITSNHWNNPESYQQSGYYTYSCAFGGDYSSLEKIIEILVVSRPFIKYTENGREKIIYSSWNLENNCRSMRQVATLAKQDTDVYNSYDLDQQEIISAFVEGRVPNFEGLD